MSSLRERWPDMPAALAVAAVAGTAILLGVVIALTLGDDDGPSAEEGRQPKRAQADRLDSSWLACCLIPCSVEDSSDADMAKRVEEARPASAASEADPLAGREGEILEGRAARTRARAAELCRTIGTRDATAQAGRDRVNAMRELADLLYEEESYDGAVAVYSWLIMSVGDTRSSGFFRHKIGLAHYKMGRSEEALRAFLDAEGWRTPETYYLMARLLHARGETDQAIEAFRHALRGGREDASLRLAMLLLEVDRRSEAIDVLVQLASRASTSREGISGMLERLESDAELEPLATAIAESGREEELLNPPALRRPVYTPAPAEDPSNPEMPPEVVLYPTSRGREQR